MELVGGEGEVELVADGRDDKEGERGKKKG